MFWTVTFIEQGRFVKVSIQGDFALEDCIKIKEDYISRDFWTPGSNILYDFREVIFGSSLTLDAMRGLGAFHESKNELIGSGRMAYLMKSARDFGLARQYEMITEGKIASKIRVFLDEPQAIEWLTFNPINCEG